MGGLQLGTLVATPLTSVSVAGGLRHSSFFRKSRYRPWTTGPDVHVESVSQLASQSGKGPGRPDLMCTCSQSVGRSDRARLQHPSLELAGPTLARVPRSAWVRGLGMSGGCIRHFIRGHNEEVRVFQQDS
jgi:hypothetical protein